MPQVTRVLDRSPVDDLDDYLAMGGGRALAAATSITTCAGTSI